MMIRLSLVLTVMFLTIQSGSGLARAEGPFSAVNRSANDVHSPVIDAPDSVVAGEPFTVTITVGKKPHPSQTDHAVQWIALYADDVELARATLTPTLTQPKVAFTVVLDHSVTLRALEQPNHSAAWESSKPITVKPAAKAK